MPGKYKLELTITHVGGTCMAGCKIGGKYDISTIKTDNMCGNFYRSIYSWIHVFYHDSDVWFLPEKDKMEVRCPDYINDVRGELVRVPIDNESKS